MRAAWILCYSLCSFCPAQHRAAVHTGRLIRPPRWCFEKQCELFMGILALRQPKYTYKNIRKPVVVCDSFCSETDRERERKKEYARQRRKGWNEKCSCENSIFICRETPLWFLLLFLSANSRWFVSMSLCNRIPVAFQMYRYRFCASLFEWTMHSMDPLELFWRRSRAVHRRSTNLQELKHFQWINLLISSIFTRWSWVGHVADVFMAFSG